MHFLKSAVCGNQEILYRIILAVRDFAVTGYLFAVNDIFYINSTGLQEPPEPDLIALSEQE